MLQTSLQAGQSEDLTFPLVKLVSRCHIYRFNYGKPTYTINKFSANSSNAS